MGEPTIKTNKVISTVYEVPDKFKVILTFVTEDRRVVINVTDYHGETGATVAMPFDAWDKLVASFNDARTRG